MYCTECGQLLPDDAKFCHNCGAKTKNNEIEIVREAPVAEYSAPPQNEPTQVIVNNTTIINQPNGKEKNKWVAFLLCLFLGEFGFHKFYEGKILMGIIYLFTFGLCGIGWLVDAIALLLKPNPYYVK